MQLGPIVQVPTNVAAGSLATATVLPVSLAAGSPRYVSSLSIYLAVAASTSRLGSGVLDAQCFLSRNVSTCDPTIILGANSVLFQNTSFTFTIPTSVGPDGPLYGVQIELFQTDGTSYSTPLNSNLFNLTSATGNWSHFQLPGVNLASASNVPCTSFACVKNCSDQFYDPPNLSSGPPSGLTNYTDCALKCPDVSSAFLPVTTTMTSVTTLSATYESTSVGSTSIYPSDMPLPLCTPTSSSSTSGLTTLSGTVGTGPSLPGTAASPLRLQVL